MIQDPFDIPAAAWRRGPGHRPAPQAAKMAGLLAPLPLTGVPLGGIGTGGIMRASDGRFARWTLKAGAVSAFDMPANGFLLRVAREGVAPEARALQPAPEARALQPAPEARALQSAHEDGALSAFAFEPEAPEWAALFPLAWSRHAALSGVRAEAVAFSPVIPGDWAAATLPAALFRWRLTNTGDTPAEVSLAFTFANLNGWFAGPEEGRPARPAAGAFNEGFDPGRGTGVVLDRRRPDGPPAEGTGQWAIALTAPEGATLSRTVCFDGTGDGAAFWERFAATGDAPDLGPGWVVEGGFRGMTPAHPAAAVCARLAIPPGAAQEIRATLAWDLPVIGFGQGRRWFRAHTDAWGRGGRAAGRIAAHALAHAADWHDRIGRWHAQTRAALGDAPHLAGQAINECHFLVDGLSVATAATGAPGGRPRFGLIECPDYALYNTMDLWIYAAEAVGRFFPQAAAAVAADYAEATLAEDATPRRHAWDATPFALNPAGVCPHDLGGPGEDPFVTPNSYTYRDPTRWKDLNCDLVLCLFREGRAMGPAWRRARFPAVRAAIGHLQAFDRDGDGLIENDGTPDQTFDNIPMCGPSAYCGGLWLAALMAGAVLAREAGEPALASEWEAQAGRGRAAFTDRLFDGRWFRVDTDGPLSAACFVEQLFGPFLARRLGLGDIVDATHARAALRSLYARNFLDEGGGEGAVSLAAVPAAARAALPHRADLSFQTAEIQPGFNLSLAAQMEAWGLAEEGAELRAALHRQLDARGLAFQTPAAFDRGRATCRAVMNMRPLAAWWRAPWPEPGQGGT